MSDISKAAMRGYGLVGYPLSHSFSSKYFADKFTRESIADSYYRNFPLEDITRLPALVHQNPDLRGLNITIPYKEQVIPFMDELDEEAEAVGAVNTIRISRTGGKVRMKGYNTDVYGFRESLLPLLRGQHRRALILGTGGASKAIAHVLGQLGISGEQQDAKRASN